MRASPAVPLEVSAKVFCAAAKFYSHVFGKFDVHEKFAHED